MMLDVRWLHMEVRCENSFGLQARPLYNLSALLAAELARRLASVLFSRRTLEIEKSSDRANFRQIQFREYSRGLRQLYSPLICLTITSESENT